MRQIRMCKLLLSILILLIACAVCWAADEPADKSSNSDLISIDFNDFPLPKAVEALFKATGRNYTVDPNISQLKVTAVFKGIPFDAALKSVLKAAGAVYRMENGVYIISARSDVPSNNGSSITTPPSGYVPNANNLTIEKIPLNFVESGDVRSIVEHSNCILLSSSNAGYMVVQGGAQNVENLKLIIGQIDTPDALPRAVRVKLTIKATVTEQGQKPKVYEATTESVGVVDAQMPLNISATRLIEYKVKIKGDNVPQFTTNGLTISLNMTPALASEAVVGSNNSLDGKIITLSGQGKISGQLPFSFDKVFDVAVSAAPGERVAIAAGSADLSAGKVEFQVTAVASVEQGRVNVRPTSQNSTTTPAGGYGGGYGGSSGQRSYGGGYGGNGSSKF